MHRTVHCERKDTAFNTQERHQRIRKTENQKPNTAKISNNSATEPKELKDKKITSYTSFFQLKNFDRQTETLNRFVRKPSASLGS